MFSKFLCGALVILGASAVYADDADLEDTRIIEEGFSALKSGNFAMAASKADLVIKRFEENKESDTDYACTSGTTDTVAAMLGAAVATDKGVGKKSKTVAISSDICSAYFLKGFALVDLQLREQALPNLEMALTLDTDNQHYANELAEWYKTGRQWERSLELFTAASEITDLSVETMDDKRESKRILNNMRCRSYRGIAFNNGEMKNWAAAREAIDKCLTLIPDDPASKAELEYINTNSGK